MEQKVPPHSTELERALLGGLMLEKNGMERVGESLSADVFFHQSHRLVYEAMLGLSQKQSAVDFNTIMGELNETGRLEDIGGETYLMELLESVISSSNLESHARLLKDKLIARKIISTASRIIEECYDEPEDVGKLLQESEESIFGISQDRIKQDVVHVKSLLPRTFEDIAKYGKGGIYGVPSGLIALDEKLSGFQKSDLIIMASRPSMGKTSLALSIAANMSIRNNIPVSFFSLELSSQQIMHRLLCAEARIDMHLLRSGKLPHRDFPRLSLAAGPLQNAPLFIDDSPSINTLELRAKCRRMKARYGIQAIFVDSLQLMRGLRRDSRELEISSISQSLKALAKELDTPVIAISQLNRKVEDRSTPRPQLADLRESGAIEQDADVVLFVYREEVYKPDMAEPGKAEIIVGKQRNGPVGELNLTFIKDYARFENYTSLQPLENQASF
jgi:replicative DNA helicase